MYWHSGILTDTLFSLCVALAFCHCLWAFVTHSYQLYQTYFTLPVQLLHKYQSLIFMHNYMYYRTKLPVVFSAYFEENKLIHQHNTRLKDDFHINVVASEFGKRAITYKGSTLWNNLPSYIKDTLSSRSFKLALLELFTAVFGTELLIVNYLI